MALYILDTDIFTLWAIGNPVVRARVGAHPVTDVATTVLTVEEQLAGWQSRLRQAKTNDDRAIIYDRMALAASGLSRLQILSCSRAALDRYDVLRSFRLNIGNYDHRIAAIALEAGAVVVTRNLRDFQRVPGLICEDWSA